VEVLPKGLYMWSLAIGAEQACHEIRRSFLVGRKVSDARKNQINYLSNSFSLHCVFRCFRT
jgi:hypothetical protein